MCVSHCPLSSGVSFLGRVTPAGYGKALVVVVRSVAVCSCHAPGLMAVVHCCMFYLQKHQLTFNTAKGNLLLHCPQELISVFILLQRRHL